MVAEGYILILRIAAPCECFSGLFDKAAFVLRGEMVAPVADDPFTVERGAIFRSSFPAACETPELSGRVACLNGLASIVNPEKVQDAGQRALWVAVQGLVTYLVVDLGVGRCKGPGRCDVPGSALSCLRTWLEILVDGCQQLPGARLPGESSQVFPGPLADDL